MMRAASIVIASVAMAASCTHGAAIPHAAAAPAPSVFASNETTTIAAAGTPVPANILAALQALEQKFPQDASAATQTTKPKNGTTTTTIAGAASAYTISSATLDAAKQALAQPGAPVTEQMLKTCGTEIHSACKNCTTGVFGQKNFTVDAKCITGCMRNHTLMAGVQQKCAGVIQALHDDTDDSTTDAPLDQDINDMMDPDTPDSKFDRRRAVAAAATSGQNATKPWWENIIQFAVQLDGNDTDADDVFDNNDKDDSIADDLNDNDMDDKAEAQVAIAMLESLLKGFAAGNAKPSTATTTTATVRRDGAVAANTASTKSILEQIVVYAQQAINDSNDDDFEDKVEEQAGLAVLQSIVNAIAGNNASANNQQDSQTATM